ncbi:MAG TPA: rod shape-determining protein MreC [Kofleriaceae bacterium]|nr:rod shape-determining protein MreC [Kofleriaceae bacterium]
MYDKQVRRRRAILALLVGLSLILLTAFFGESVGGPLKTIQRGMLEVLSPIQDGASRALKPFKDLTNWVGDTFDAKDRASRLEKQRDVLRKQVIGANQAVQENAQLKRMVNLNAKKDLSLSTYKPVTGRVIARSPSLWFTTITVDVGSSDGVHDNQPVLDGSGLVGKVTDVTSDAAVVTLITDHTSGVSSTVQRLNDSGILQTAAGNPNDLLLSFLPPKSAVKVGETVVTSGTKSSRLDSLFPPGIPIGTVTKADPEELNLYQRVHVKPFADLRRLDFVQVLTQPHAQVVASAGAATK